jgi:hypothetical protein
MERKQGRSIQGAAKLELVSRMAGLSQRDCERKLYEISPQSALPGESTRIVSATEREFRTYIREDVHHKIERIRGLLAHAKPDATLAELLEEMADITLSVLEKKRGITQVARQAAAADKTADAVPDSNTSNHTAAARTEKIRSSKRITLPRTIQRMVWFRASGRCEYANNGNRCTSRYRLEIDHVRPLALGGTNETENLRLLCRVHNRQQARAMGLG